MKKKTMELNKTNNELDKQISPENQEAFTDIICYLRGSSLSDYHQELVRHDLLEMILSAQSRGESLRSVIGSDYKAFCDDVIASLPAKTAKEKVLEYLDTICAGTAFLWFLNISLLAKTRAILGAMLSGSPTDLQVPISVGMIASIIIVIGLAILIVNHLTSNSLREESKKPFTVLKGALAGAAVAALFLLVAWFGKGTLFTMNIFVAYLIAIGLFAGHKLLERLS